MRTLIVVGDRITPLDDATAGPRRDYDALAARLNAGVIDASVIGRPRGRGLGGVMLARHVARRAGDYDSIYCDSEHIGLPLAFLLRRRVCRPRLTMIAHYLTPAKKRLAIRALRLYRAIDRVVLHAPAQLARARALGFAEDRLALVPYHVDTDFWRSETTSSAGTRIASAGTRIASAGTRIASAGTHIASAGQEFRDYMTLFRAVDGIDIPVRIAAGSQWSRRPRNFRDADVPPNVTIGRLPYGALREIYAGARFVVVPLHDVDFQAGIITILEAMSMGKAVIVSRTRGQTGVVSGPLMERGRLRDIGENTSPAHTGIYVPPGDPASLRDAITWLIERPAVAARMGAAGRALVDAELSLERFVDRMAAIIAPVATPEAAEVRA
jgi:glycosyltransferase involved in cell wall biosynthesis